MGGGRGRGGSGGGRNEKGEGSGYCAACGGRIPTGGFPNIVFNFLKAARDPETASPGARDPGAGRAGEPGQSPPRPRNPRLRVGATWPLPATAGPAPEGGWAGAAGSAKALKSKTIATQGELRQVGLRLWRHPHCPPPSLCPSACRPAAPRLLGW